jgi:hypothetical protein
MTIALLCPTRARPEQCKRMIQSAYNTSNQYIQIYLAVSEDEFDIYKSIIELPDSNRVGVVMVSMPDGMPTAHKWNRLAELAINQKPNLLMLCADDTVFTTPCWDKALLDHYNALENKIHVYALRDSRDTNGTPHPIVTREYIEAMGYFLPPIFMHWFVDSWTVAIAKANSCFTHLTDYLLVHDKPSDKDLGDETHNRIRQMGWHERDKWVAERCKDWLSWQKYSLWEKLARPKNCESHDNWFCKQESNI